MEAGNSSARQRDIRDRPPYREQHPIMATAALLNPSPHYPQHHHAPYSSNYSHTSTSSSMPGIISPVEPRRAVDDHEPHRQSLPSIQEVIGAKHPTSAFAPPSISTSVSGAPSLPSPFASTSNPPRPFPDLGPSQDKRSSPRSLHNPTSFPSRDPPPSMPPYDPARPSLSSRPPPPPPVNTYHPGVRPSPPPPLKMETHSAAAAAEQQPRQQREQSHRPNGSGYPHSAVSEPASLPPYPPQPVQLPPGQLPLSAHPMSPRYSAGPSLPSPYDGSRSSTMHEDGDYMRRTENKYEQTLNRHFEAWQYQESLAKIASGSRTIFNFADAYGRCAAEEQGPSTHMPSRLPSEREIGDMLNMAEWMRGMLDNLRTMVQHSIVMNDRAREANRGKNQYEDEEMSMYGESIKSPYDMGGVKKRRGRAAPPGRCHSCNRIDTPEWRRGPDGARTLCNACGLHYAKLERKKQIDAKNVRPRPSVERS